LVCYAWKNISSLFLFKHVIFGIWLLCMFCRQLRIHEWLLYFFIFSFLYLKSCFTERLLSFFLLLKWAFRFDDGWTPCKVNCNFRQIRDHAVYCKIQWLYIPLVLGFFCRKKIWMKVVCIEYCEYFFIWMIMYMLMSFVCIDWWILCVVFGFFVQKGWGYMTHLQILGWGRVYL